MAYNETIRTRREALGMSQYALAQRIGCIYTMISRWESGRVKPRLKYAEKLAAALGGVADDYR